ncbi:MAG: hypothetical protein JRH14_07690 [Deltaproteobacteria bacterium]|nr:hypothetical protein [Deltaproteobacteria bacterium]MBW2381332.1 hypothetical protein [Deltaproteobacteria bacterium]
MIDNNIVRAAICIGVLITGIGCGDAASGTACEEACGRIDSCPNLESRSTCVSSCEASVADAELLGGTCPGTFDDALACYKQLSCSALSVRAISAFSQDDCTPYEQRVSSCEPGDPVDPADPAGPVNEVALACEAFCSAAEACPNVELGADCRDVCAESVTGAEVTSSACGSAFIDTIDCVSNMTCSDLAASLEGPGAAHACSTTEQRSVAICAQ